VAGNTRPRRRWSATPRARIKPAPSTTARKTRGPGAKPLAGGTALRRCRSIFLGASLGLHANRPEGKAGLECHRPPRRPRGNEGAGAQRKGTV
jgi:hypothetical protein